MANALLDFLQGASNSAAANVSAPVDGIAWLLRKAGINVDRPVGGSDWMRERGLTAEPTNKLAGILGESVGGVLPMVTAAKAPQIAQGLLQAEKNLAAPRTLNPQTGAILWHGSPHKFDAFDSSKIGTGEGAQAYGHGLYLADSPDVAKGYQNTLAPQNFSSIVQNGRNDYSVVAKDGSKIVDGVLLGKAHKAKEAFDATQTGALYKVDLPDEHIAKMLDWDKPLSQQSPEVQKALFSDIDEAIAMTRKSLETASERRAPATADGLDKLLRERTRIANLNGGNYYKQKSLGITSGQPDAAEALRSQGIPGIRYLDGGSRGTGAGTSNYVVFPGNEGLLSILERNGQPLK